MYASRQNSKSLRETISDLHTDEYVRHKLTLSITSGSCVMKLFTPFISDIVLRNRGDVVNNLHSKMFCYFTLLICVFMREELKIKRAADDNGSIY